LDGDAMAELMLELLLVPVDMFLCLTGELILFVVAFGRHRVRWDLYTSERPGRFVMFSEMSRWVGLGFWIILTVIAHRCLYGASV
jgi:hypothetical protein